jgi:cbb3-type cytochrome oxidase maturation protein
MTLLLLLVPLSVVLLGIAIAAFAWAVRSGQFDDLDTPPLDVLREDTMAPPTPRDATPQAAARDDAARPD